MQLPRLYRHFRRKLGLSLRLAQRQIADSFRPPLFDYKSETLNDRWVIEKVFPGKRGGYFIEAGAASGHGASCTYLLEKELGWTGLCVEPNDQFFSELLVNRPNSHCENVCLAKEAGIVQYIEGAETTVSPYLGGIKSHLETMKHGGRQVVALGREVEKRAVTLEALLDKHQAPPVIEYAAFDMEGAELEVLQGFPFQKYALLAISVECDGIVWDDVTRLLAGQGYREARNPFNVDKPWERYWLHRSLAAA